MKVLEILLAIFIVLVFHNYLAKKNAEWHRRRQRRRMIENAHKRGLKSRFELHGIGWNFPNNLTEKDWENM